MLICAKSCLPIVFIRAPCGIKACLWFCLANAPVKRVESPMCRQSSDDVLRRIAIRPRHAFIAPIKRFFRRQLQPVIIDIVLRLNTGSKHIDDKLTAGPFRCPAEMTTVTNDLTRAVHLALYDAPHLLLFFYRLHALLTLLILQCNALLSRCALFPKKITHPYVHLPSSPFKCPFTFCPDLKGKERKGDQYRAKQCKGVSR